MLLLLQCLSMIFKVCLYTIIMNYLTYYKYDNNLELSGFISILKDKSIL